MNIRRALVATLLASALATAAACGGSGTNKTIQNASELAGKSPSVSASVAANATPTPAPSAVSEYGPPPVLGGNVTDVAPGWGKSVTQAATRTSNPSKPSGVCADVSFSPPATSNLWFRMAVDGQEVTSKLTVVGHDTGSPGKEDIKTATLCYPPADGLSPGLHSAAVSVQEPNNLTASPLQTVAWKFTVTP